MKVAAASIDFVNALTWVSVLAITFLLSGLLAWVLFF